MQHPDEGMIHTWLDGELPPDEAAAFEAHVSECAECTAAVAEARGLIAASSRIVGSLDLVPRGVIPVPKPVRRSWYETTQFRAAAALLLIAGTSLVLARNGSESRSTVVADKAHPVMTTEHAVLPAPQSAPAVEAVVPQAQARKMSSVPPAEAPAAVTPKPSVPSARSRALSANADQAANRPVDEVAETRDARVPTSNAIAAMKAAPLRGAISGAVATGVAAAAESDAQLKIVRSDTTGIVRKTVIAVPEGVEVTLTEFQPQSFSSSGNRVAVKTMAEQQRQTAAAPAPVRAPTTTGATPKAADADLSKSTAVHTIRWTDQASGIVYTLSGPLSPDQLEALKPKILELKR